MRRYEVFSTRSGRTIAIVPFRFLAIWLCNKLDRCTVPFAYDYLSI